MIINYVLHTCKMKIYIYIYIDFYLSQLMKLFTKKKKKKPINIILSSFVNNLPLNKKYKNKISPTLKIN